MRRAILCICLLLAAASHVRAADLPDFKPDPRSVQRSGSGYRYPQAGWIVLHIEGKPYERGYQHGQLMAPEIVSYVKCFAAMQNAKAPAEGWKATRTLVNALFLRKFDPEFLEEMKGIADGAAAAAAKFDDRPIDLVDIVALNCWAEAESLDSALEATPTGLEGIRFPKQQPKPPSPAKPMHCSAFAAVGPATKDGKIVFGHVTMFNLYPSLHFNVWLDVKPAQGQRVLMQSYPGGIQSGMDYYMNDAGILMLETTIDQTRFNPNGLTVASRTRKALQYSRSIEQAVEFLQKDNNGLYTNEWMLADINKNEIAMFELGTTKSKLYRSSKNEWFGGTEGFYWGCNNTKDLQVRLDTVPAVNGRPANVVWKPTDRDIRWQELYTKYKGKIDDGFGKVAFQTTPLCSAITIDAKYTTTDLARQLKSHALFGPPLGKSWQPTDDEKKNYPEIRPLVSNPWTILHGAPPERGDGKETVAVDLPDKVEEAAAEKEDRKQSLLRGEDRTATLPAWHGTILPATDADIWLASAFADYEKFVSLENALLEKAKDGKLDADEHARLALELFAHRSAYLTAARSKADVALGKIESKNSSDEWHHIAAGKGVLALHTLRGLLGNAAFEKALDAFGRDNAGKTVTTAQFQEHIAKTAPKCAPFFAYWQGETGLPRLELASAQVKKKGKEHIVVATIKRTDAGGPSLKVDVTVETEDGEETTTCTLTGAQTTCTIKTEETPRRVVVDKYGLTARANGGSTSVLAFHREPEQTLIVYGTGNEQAANQETALALQEAIRTSWCHCTVAVKADTDVRDDDLKTHHLLLVGRPDCNRVVERVRTALPVDFGSRSFVANGEIYAHALSGVIVAAENPANPRYSVVVLAGLSAEATTRLPALLLKKGQKEAEAIVLAGGQAKLLVLPAKELVRNLAP